VCSDAILPITYPFSGRRLGRNDMDPTTAGLAASVMTVLIPYAAKGAEEFSKSVGKDAYEKVKSLLSILKTRWAGDKEAMNILARFEEKPQLHQTMLEDILIERLAQDKELAKELVNQLNNMGPELEIIQKMEEGRRVTGLEAEEMNKGRARVYQDVERGEDIRGGRFGRIG
jgi:hypothetical protein